MRGDRQKLLMYQKVRDYSIVSSPQTDQSIGSVQPEPFLYEVAK